MTKNQKIYLWIWVFIVLIIFLGNYHIVTDVWIIERPYFWFSDVVGNSVKCTNISREKAETLHPSLCPALRDWAYLATLSADELQRKLDCVDRCPSDENFNECNRLCKQEEVKTTEDISVEACIDSCKKEYSNSYIFDTNYKNCLSTCEK